MWNYTPEFLRHRGPFRAAHVAGKSFCCLVIFEGKQLLLATWAQLPLCYSICVSGNSGGTWCQRWFLLWKTCAAGRPADQRMTELHSVGIPAGRAVGRQSSSGCCRGGECLASKKTRETDPCHLMRKNPAKKPVATADYSHWRRVTWKQFRHNFFLWNFNLFWHKIWRTFFAEAQQTPHAYWKC